MMQTGAMVVALAVEVAVGWPDALYARIGHPVTWIGKLIGACDHAFNRAADDDLTRRLRGLGTALAITALVAALAGMAVHLLPGGWTGTLLTGVLAWPLVATRSLHDHVARVALPLAQGDLAGARRAVAMIVGRDPETLDRAGVARAALESLAESTSDGVVAPVFWGAIFGLPGIAAYKAINTMDSMIGHLSPKYAAFGWAAARIDDLVNLIPARLSGALFVALAGLRWRQAWAVMLADAGHHRSPNAGWPEAALAGALNIRLSGPRVYDGQVTAEPWVNASAPDPTPADLTRGLHLYRLAMMALAAVLLALAWL
jgi:adenosylcobinamide-phosphate synthase